MAFHPTGKLENWHCIFLYILLGILLQGYLLLNQMILFYTKCSIKVYLLLLILIMLLL